MLPRHAFTAIALACFAGAPALGQVIHDEGVDGDLSGDRFNPTAYVLGLGSNRIIATSGPGDREFVALTVPAGMLMSALIQVDYIGEDGVAFAAVDDGPQFLVDPDAFTTAGMLGWTHFGPVIFPNGSDILPAMGMGFGADGFVPPLPAGTYTFWLQQTGEEVTYELDFFVIPAPGAAGLLGFGAVWAVRRRRTA
ncbi:MAG: hypothetical protein KF869_13670 [Phycisphaeraceae bacterium]|nr:hypothetical protein [Phycisphaeraceae bacterium]